MKQINNDHLVTHKGDDALDSKKRRERKGSQGGLLAVVPQTTQDTEVANVNVTEGIKAEDSKMQ